MKNKQKALLKILLPCVLCVAAANSRAQNENLLARADSLFLHGQYTQSMELYEGLFSRHLHSHAMLLRMAFIAEGLGNFGEALYFLNLYQLASGDQQALEKIRQMADRHHLEGYDHDRLLAQVHTLRQRYGMQANLALAAGMLLLFSWMYVRRKAADRPYAAGFALLVLGALLFANLNFSAGQARGIVRQESTYLMSGPSAGASVVAIVGQGNMLPIRNQTDIWVQVEWRDQKAFVRENQLFRIEI